MAVKKKLKELLNKFKTMHVVDLERIKRMERVAQAARDAAKTDKAQ